MLFTRRPPLSRTAEMVSRGVRNGWGVTNAVCPPVRSTMRRQWLDALGLRSVRGVETVVEPLIPSFYARIASISIFVACLAVDIRGKTAYSVDYPSPAKRLKSPQC
jgi:hypothetical protein